MFYDDPRVFYLTVHQSPFYPGTGADDETGSGAGEGFTLNAPLEAGATDGDYERLWRELLAPAIAAYAPEALLVSAGFDAHEHDPLGGMRLTVDGYAALAAEVKKLAEEVCGGSLMFVLEGGYNLRALAESVLATIEVLAGTRTGIRLGFDNSTHRSEQTIGAVRAARARFQTL
jgi:acetoin utilization deacetylase AcuC-like enzyme